MHKSHTTENDNNNVDIVVCDACLVDGLSKDAKSIETTLHVKEIDGFIFVDVSDDGILVDTTTSLVTEGIGQGQGLGLHLFGGYPLTPQGSSPSHQG